MRLIAHRGLVDGPNAELENTPAAITACLLRGLDVEIDVWYHQSQWRLGHDAPTHPVTDEFVTQPNLWVHAKNFEACEALSQLFVTYPYLNFFWHENDARVLTSQAYWWTTHVETLPRNSIAVMPEWSVPVCELTRCLDWRIFGICTDWVSVLRNA
jgi:hypothetical protein